MQELKSFRPNGVHMFKKTLSTLFRQAVPLALLGLLAAAQTSLAQPVVGQTYKDFLPMGSGASVPLPEGVWKNTHNDSMSFPGEVWNIHVLKNQTADAKVPYLVVRQETLPRPWNSSLCQSIKSTHQFMMDTHGAAASSIIQKCSMVFGIGDFQGWKKGIDTWTNERDKNWWKAALPGMLEDVPSFKTSVFQALMQVQQFNGKKIQVDAFVLPPKGITASKFRDDFRIGTNLPEHGILNAWISIYVEAIQQSFFNKKPQQIMALGYPVRVLADAQGQQNTLASVVTTGIDTQAVRDLEESSRSEAAKRLDAPPSQLNEQPRKTAELVPPARETVPASLAQEAKKPALAAAFAPALAAVPAADNAEKLRLEQERKAIEEDKRKMAAQLEAMTQMLAKLQQENAAAAAAAAQAKEAASAVPMESSKSQQAVTYANRKALVIGNDKYSDVSPLANAAADADAMAKSLEAVGYKVFKHHNLGEKKFKQAVRDFRQQLNGGDEVLFFYAGHGVQLGSANYLLPIDIKGEGEDQIKDDAILLQKVLDDLEEKKTKFALAVIDACRDNPFKGKGRALGGRGLAPTTAATGQMIMFSAGSGQQALDRLGDNDKEKNGLFTRIFVKEMMKPGLSVDRVFRNVRNEVVRLAKSVGHEQTPALYDQAIGEFYFKQ